MHTVECRRSVAACFFVLGLTSSGIGIEGNSGATHSPTVLVKLLLLVGGGSHSCRAVFCVAQSVKLHITYSRIVKFEVKSFDALRICNALNAFEW